MRVIQEKIPTAKEHIKAIEKAEKFGFSFPNKIEEMMEEYLKLHLKAIRYEYNQYQFFLDGYRNGSASLGEINDAHNRFIKLLDYETISSK